MNSLGDLKYFPVILGVIAGAIKVVTTALGGLSNVLSLQMRWCKIVIAKSE